MLIGHLIACGVSGVLGGLSLETYLLVGLIVVELWGITVCLEWWG
jgi:hypothetical protein